MRKGNTRGLLHPCRLLHGQFQMNEREAFHSWGHFCADQKKNILPVLLRELHVYLVLCYNSFAHNSKLTELNETWSVCKCALFILY